MKSESALLISSGIAVCFENFIDMYNENERTYCCLIVELIPTQSLRSLLFKQDAN